MGAGKRCRGHRTPKGAYARRRGHLGRGKAVPWAPHSKRGLRAPEQAPGGAGKRRRGHTDAKLGNVHESHTISFDDPNNAREHRGSWITENAVQSFFLDLAFLGLGVWPISTINLSSVASSQVAKAQNASGR